MEYFEENTGRMDFQRRNPMDHDMIVEQVLGRCKRFDV